MGFEYSGRARSEQPLVWQSIASAVGSLIEVEPLSNDPHGLAFNIRSIERDRSRWTHDGMLTLNRDGSLYLCVHLAPLPEFVEELARVLAAAGMAIEFEEL